MFTVLTRLVLVLLVFCGCGDHSTPTTKEQSKSEADFFQSKEFRIINDSLLSAEKATNATAKWAAYWPIVLKNYTKNAKLQEITGNPITSVVSLSETPYEWSFVDLYRDEPGDPSTIDNETWFTLTGIPWSPLKEPLVHKAMSEKKSGRCEFVEILYEAQSDKPIQFRRVRFRMLPVVDN